MGKPPPPSRGSPSSFRPHLLLTPLQLAGLSHRIANGTAATKLPGIGKQIGKKIDEYIATGKLAKLEKIEGDEVREKGLERGGKRG